MKDFLTKEKINSIIARANNLRPDAQPLWGKMSVTDMLFHCALINNQILNNQKEPRAPRLKERFLKPVFYVLNRFPKGIKSGDKYLPLKTDVLVFNQQLNAFIESMHRFKNYQQPITGIHPIFGPLKNNEWRKFVLLHMDHHLRQFNV